MYFLFGSYVPAVASDTVRICKVYENPVKRLKVYNLLKSLIDKGVTFWGLSDKHKWVDNHPFENGHKDYPLIFDTKLCLKKAFYEISSFGIKDKKNNHVIYNKYG